MSYLDINKFSFNDKSLRGFSISCIDDYKINITDLEVVFQKNRAIVFNIIIEDIEIIKYLKNESPNIIMGNYYHYSFISIIESINNKGMHPPFYTYSIVIDLINFSKNKTFFINSDNKYELEIIPTENMTKYIKRIKQDNLLKFKNTTFSDYNLKYRHLIDLNSFIYNTPILIEKVIIKHNNTSNILFQSQNINEHLTNKFSEDYSILVNGHFTSQLDKYLDKFVELVKSKNTLYLLLNIYFISDIFNGKKDYHLNDISGFIDLFDGVFYQLEGKKEKITKYCKNEKCIQEFSFDKEYSLRYKIDFILDKLDPELKKYKLDTDKSLSKTLSAFRNMIRHQLPFKEFDLNKLYTFSKGVLRLYIIKYILNITNEDYDINRILSDFDIYPLVKHIYKYNNDEITIYNTPIHT